MSNRGSEYTGNIVAIRAIEDCIRATKKYTEGVRTIRKSHPIQGGEFPSKAFCKYYEVYPDIDVEVSWDMPLDKGIDLVWGDTPCIDVIFNYDYRVNKASVIIKDGPIAVKELAQAIPNFSYVLAKAIAGRNGNALKV